MKKLQFIFAAAALLVLSLGMTGCDPTNPNNPETPAIVSTSETNNDRWGIIVEAIYKNNTRMYFRLTSPNTCEVVSYELYYNNSEGFSQYAYSGEMVIPETFTHKGNMYMVTTIGALVSRDLQITTVWIPKTIEGLHPNLDYYGYIYEQPLQAFNVATDNPYYTSIDGVLFNKGKTVLIRFPRGKTGKTYTIPDGVKDIGGDISDSPFEGSSLTEITLPNSIMNLGWLPFDGCSSLTSITSFATTPPILDIDTASVKTGAPMLKTAKVPSGSVSAYRAAAGWKDLTIVAL